MEDRPERIHRIHLGPEEVQRDLRPRHIGDHQVVHRRFGQTTARVHPHRDAENSRTGELTPVLQQRGRNRPTVFLGGGVVRRDRPQSLAGVLDLGLQAGEHARHLIAARPVGAIVHRHRHHGHQGCLRQFRPIEHVLPQHAGHQRQHYVVDLHVEVVLDGLDVLEVELSEGDVAVRGDGGVERGVRSGERRCHRAAVRDSAHRLHHGGHRRRQDLGRELDRPRSEPAQPTEGDPEGIHPPAGLDRLRRRRIGLHRTQLRHQVGAAHTVDRGVVNLRHHREPSPFTHAGAAESVDHPHLPQRVATIQRQRR